MGSAVTHTILFIAPFPLFDVMYSFDLFFYKSSKVNEALLKSLTISGLVIYARDISSYCEKKTSCFYVFTFSNS